MLDPVSIPLIEVSLVTDNKTYLHPYQLRSGSENLLPLSMRDLLNDEQFTANRFKHYYLVNRGVMSAELDNLNIIEIQKSRVLDAIANLNESTSSNIVDAQAELIKYDDLNRCRLKLQAVAFNKSTKKVTKYLSDIVYTDTIINMNPMSSIVNIGGFDDTLCVLSANKFYSKYDGEDEIFLYTTFVEHDNIGIEFFERNDNTGDILWYKNAELTHTDVLYNCLIIFHAPKYDSLTKDENSPLGTKVYFRLFRPRSNQYSKEMEFYYIKDDMNVLNNYKTEFLKQCAANRKKNEQNKRNERKEIVDELQINAVKQSGRASNQSEPVAQISCKIEEDSPRIKELCEPTASTSKWIAQSKEGGMFGSIDASMVANTKKEINMEIEKEEKIVAETNDMIIKNSSDEESVNEEKPSGFDEVDSSGKEKQNDNVSKLREKLQNYEEKMNNLADRTSLALLETSETRSLYQLIGTQRYLLSAQDDDGNNPIHLSILNSNFDVLEIFVDIASTIPDYDIINMKNNQMLTPLLLAASLGEPEVCAFLLESKANIFISDQKGSNCFHVACKNNDLRLLQTLTKYILNNKRKSQVINKFNNDGLTPLHVAVKNNSIKLVEELLKLDACDVNAKCNKDGMTPLHYAAQFGCIKISALLAKHKNVILDLEAYNYTTPLHLAVIHKNYFIVRILVQHTAKTFAETIHCVYDNCKIAECVGDKKGNAMPDMQKRIDEAKNFDINRIKHLQKDFHAVLAYSKLHYTTYHYAFGDEIMYTLLNNEKTIEKRILNKILYEEIQKVMKKGLNDQLDMVNKSLKDKLNNPNSDFIGIMENLRGTKLHHSTDVKQTDADKNTSLADINNGIENLHIGETPTFIGEEEEEKNME